MTILDRVDLSRKRATTILCIVGGALSLIYATSAGEYLVTITDLFVNNLAILFSVVIECILFAWIFKVEKLVKFLNSKSKSLKIGKIWLILVRYVIPVLVVIIWIGGVYELTANNSGEFVSLLILLSLLVLIFALIFTVLPAKFEKWFETEERID